MTDVAVGTGTMPNDDRYVAFNKHVAAELIKQDVLATNPELAHELKCGEMCSGFGGK